MSWRDLLEKGDETVTVPWLGGRVLQSPKRTWNITGRLPDTFGWYTFKVKGNKAFEPIPGNPDVEGFGKFIKGYLVGDHVVPDGTGASGITIETLTSVAKPVHLVEEGLDRFARVVAAPVYSEGPLIYISQDMPIGPEEAVYRAFLDRKDSIAHVRDVSPGLDAAFRVETLQRDIADKRRAELAEQRRIETERLAKEARRLELAERLGTGLGRRELAKIDFREAAEAALKVAGAEFLDERKGRANERVVVFRAHQRKFECVVDDQLRIIDSGICLTAHGTGERGDDRFTLETLPGVIGQAIREHKLVVLRHADGPNYDDQDDEEY